MTKGKRKMTTVLYYALVAALLIAVIIAVCVIINIKKANQEIQDLQAQRTKEFIQAQCYINSLEDMNAELQAENSALLEKTKKLESKETVKETPEEEKAQLPDKEAIPDGLTNRYLFMDYRTITNKKSEQWRLQELCLTDSNTGARYLDCDNGQAYAVALAANYGRTIGDCWLVELDNGNYFFIVLAEFKDDGNDPLRMGDPCKNFDGEDVTNVIEFIVDCNIMPKYIYQAGSLSAHPRFDGNIEKMSYIGCIDWK